MKKKDDPIIRITIYFPQSWHKRLVQVVREQGKIRSTTLTELLKDYVIQEENKKK